MRTKLVAAALAVAVLAPAPALAAAEGDPCGEVSISYAPTSVPPRGLVGYTEDVHNCSSSGQRFLLVTRTVGPCGADRRTAVEYALPADGGLASHADFLAPRCEGTYRTAAVLMVDATRQVLDRDTASFVVTSSAGT